MADIKVEDAKRYLKAIKASKQKYLTCEMLSKDIGIYPDIIASHLSYFDPIIMMDMGYDIHNIVPRLSDFVKEKEASRKPLKKAPKLAETKYKTVNDFVFSKFVVAGGLMDRSIELSDADLKELKRIITNEIKNRKKKKYSELFDNI